MLVQFYGGPRDGESWPHACPPPGRYWIDRTIRAYGVPTAQRSDLYEFRAEPEPGWYFIRSKDGHHRP